MQCRSCGRDAPDGTFCTICGADQRAIDAPRPDGLAAPRWERFAAHPDEHVMQPGLMTTLFPHLDHARVNEFRWALFAGLGVILLLYLAGLITAAILVAAFLVPILYVLYVYEVRVFRDAPVLVFGLTFGAGIVIGVVVTIVGNLVRGPLPAIDASPFGINVDLAAFLLSVVVLPVIQEVLKPIPALALRGRAEFSQTIDGLVLGVAAGLGFALAQTIVQLSGVIATLDVRTDPANWIFPLVTYAVLLPVLHGSSTGVIAAALWRIGKRHRGRLEAGGLIAGLASQVAFAAGTQLVVASDLGQPVVLIWQALVVGSLLLYVRFLLHVSLREEAASFGLVRRTCPNCGQTNMAAGFCPSCGMALSAATGSKLIAGDPMVGASVRPAK